MNDNIIKGERKIARKLREWYPGAIYHLMHRGVRRTEIFSDETDYQVFLEILKVALDKHDSIENVVEDIKENSATLDSALIPKRAQN